MLRELSLVALGGAAGAVSRYLTGLIVTAISDESRILTGVFAANIIGCFLIGLIYARLMQSGNQEKRLLLLVGFTGSYTTFSAFAIEGLEQLSEAAMFGFLYVTIQVAAGLMAVFAGILCTRWINR